MREHAARSAFPGPSSHLGMVLDLVGIKLDKQARVDTYERAIRDARDPLVVTDQTWTARIQWLSDQVAQGDAKGRTYIPAVGGALLAKSVDPDVDLLTQRLEGGPRGYYLRGVVEQMQKQARNIVHLGTPSANPMNNAPFLRGPARVDRLPVASYLEHIYETYLDWMREANSYSRTSAYDALVAFVAVRMAAQRTEDTALATGTRMQAAASTSDLLGAVQLWATEDPEEGARGQALVAAALSLTWGTGVEVVPKHHPAPFDVRLPPTLACEVKQRAVQDSDVLELARRAASAGYDVALYAALSLNQRPLAVDRLRRDALDQHGVLLDIVYDSHDLVAKVGVYGGVRVARVAAQLGQRIADFSPRAGVSTPGLQRLVDLLS